MRSSRELALCAVLAALGACGIEPSPSPPGKTTGGEQVIEVDPDECETSYLDYDNFGAPFISNWCRGCHSATVPAGMRQKAPAAVNFDTLEDVQTWANRIVMRAASTEPSMPPAGGPTVQERALLAEWVACGTR